MAIPLVPDQVIREYDHVLANRVDVLADKNEQAFLVFAVAPSASCERELEEARAEILRLRALKRHSARLGWAPGKARAWTARRLLTDCEDDDKCLQAKPAWGSGYEYSSPSSCC